MTTSCEEVEPMIGLLLDHELDSEQSQEVATHLESCSSCRSLFEEEDSLRAALRRAAATVDAPMALRRRLRLTMERERRSQVGMARAWPAAVAAAILVSFVWHGEQAQVPSGLSQLSQAHQRVVPMDVVSAEPQVVAHFLRTQLHYNVPVEQIAASVAGAKPQQLAARIVEQDGRQSALLRLAFEHGSMTLVVSCAQADEAQAATAPQSAQAAIAALGVRPSARAGAQRGVYMAQDAQGLTVAQWQTRGLVYDMVSDLPQAQLATSVQQLTR